MLNQLITDYLDYIKNNNAATKTVTNRKSILTTFSRRGIDLSELDYVTLESYFSDRREQLKDSSFQLERGVIRSFLEYCQEIRGVEMAFRYTVIKRRKVRGQVKFLPREDVALAICNAKNQQDKLIIATLFETGIRIGELVNLKAEHIQGDELVIMGKGGKQRVAIMPAGLGPRMFENMARNGSTTGHVFIPLQRDKDQVKYKADSVRKRIEARFAEVGIIMYPHMLRHGYGTELYQKKVDLRAIQTLMGHANISTTEIYTHVTNPFLREVYKMAMPTSILA